MKSLIITTPLNGEFNTNLINLLDAAKQIASNCDIVLIGYDLNRVAHDIANLPNVSQIFVIDSPHLNNLLVENIAGQLSELVKTYTHVLVAADSFGKNLLPRIAGILELGQISEVVNIVSPNVFKQFTYAGNVLVEVESLEEIKLLTVRTTNFSGKTVDRNQDPANISSIEYTENTHPAIKWLDQQLIDKSVDLSLAKVVVSGGRSLGSLDNFNTHIRTLATKLNAAVGATRAAVEAGFAPNDCQVGQTGKIVAPEVYLAVGISGAVQHIAGMKDSKTVIAINTDQTAPIFEHANYGLVGDLFDVLPELNQLINQL